MSCVQPSASSVQPPLLFAVSFQFAQDSFPYTLLCRPAREPRPNLILPIFIHPPRARIRQQRTVVRFVILPECRHAFARPPAADGVVAVLERTWASGYWRHPEVHLAVFVGAQRDVEARWFPVAVGVLVRKVTTGVRGWVQLTSSGKRRRRGRWFGAFRGDF